MVNLCSIQGAQAAETRHLAGVSSLLALEGEVLPCYRLHHVMYSLLE